MEDYWNPWMTDAQIAQMTTFREQTGRERIIEVASFLQWLGPHDPPVTPEMVMEYLWGYSRLYRTRYRPEGVELRSEIADFLRFLGPDRVSELDACTAVAGDRETFDLRWDTFDQVPLALWLEELRTMVTTCGRVSTVPPLDTSDPAGIHMRQLLRPGSQALEGLALSPLAVPGPQAIAGSQALTLMAQLLGIVGDGTKLTVKGNLGMKDARALADAIGYGHLFDQRIGDRVFKTRSSAEVGLVDLAFKWGRAAGLLRVNRGRLLPTARGRKFGKDPMADWWVLFRAAALKPGWAAGRWPEDRRPFWAKDFAAMLPAYVRVLAERAAGGVSLQVMAECIWAVIEGDWDTWDMTPDQIDWQVSMVSSGLRFGLLVPLQMLGAAECWEGGAGRACRLTQTGLWAAGKLAAELTPKQATQELPGNVVDIASRRSGSGLLPAWQPAARVELLPDNIAEALDSYLLDEGPNLSVADREIFRAVLDLLVSCLDGYAYETLEPADRALWDRRWKADEVAGSYCNTFGPGKVPEHLSMFLGYFLIRKVMAGPDLYGAAGRVVRRLLAWLQVRGYIETAVAQQAMEQALELGDQLSGTQELAMALYDEIPATTPEPTLEEWEGDSASIARVEPGRLWLRSDAGKSIGPVVVSENTSKLARSGWTVSAPYLVRMPEGWFIGEFGNVYPD